MRDALYARARTVAHQILELPPDERPGHLSRSCGDDAALLSEVQWLLDAAGDPRLDELPPAITVTADSLSADLRVEPVAAGGYRLLERLGEGGMGVVWLAERDVAGTRMRVALKRLHAGSITQQARFHEEQRILATLNHRNIAHLVDAGDDTAGNPYLAMEYVEGERIDRWCDRNEAALRERVELFLKVCAAVSYAHERLVIHRDIKPANILVDAAGEPKLLDFGIARLVDADATVTLAARAMTIAYASPEQIEGAPLGTATDVWSLGAVLYELVSGARLFGQASTDHAMSGVILSGALVPPSQRAQRASRGGENSGDVPSRAHARYVPPDIDAIVLKALRREPEQRYASVREFADDLRCFLDARPVSARRGRWTYHAQRFVQRQRWPLAAAALVVAIVAAFTWRTVLAEREARLQAQVAETTTELLISAFSLSDPTEADRHDFSAREVLDRSRDQLDEALAGQPQVRARLLEALGNAYRGINEGSAGAPLLEEAARLHLDPAVNDPLAAARSLRAKAISVLGSRGSTDEAERAARRAFELFREHAGGADLILADAYGTLALALDAAGKDADAMAAARQALSLREAAGADPSMIARSLRDLCIVATSIGEYAQAVGHCDRARALHLQAGSVRSNEYRLLLAQLAGTLSYSGDHQRSLSMLRESVALTQALFGDDSSALASARNALAVKLADLGAFDEAAGLIAQSLPVVLRRNGRDSTQYAQAVSVSSWIKYRTGEFEDAELHAREALAIHAPLVGDHDNDRLQVLRRILSMTLIASGRASDEVRTLLDAMIELRSTSEANPTALAYAHLPLAQWHLLRGELDAATELLDRVDRLGDRIEPEMHAVIAATRAAIRRAQGDPAGALSYDRQAFEVTAKDIGVDSPRTGLYALTYARSLRAIGDAAGAERIATRFRAQVETAYPPTSAFRQRLAGDAPSPRIRPHPEALQPAG